MGYGVRVAGADFPRRDRALVWLPRRRRWRFVTYRPSRATTRMASVSMRLTAPRVSSATLARSETPGLKPSRFDAVVGGLRVG